ncbi:hypothetical protein [Arthrobacter pascens]|uniref:hypothetical protein n=1 Tax=Arthrobacter pascens TaxID=1677 RepID=UPI0035B5039C
MPFRAPKRARTEQSTQGLRHDREIPLIGYDAATSIAREALSTGRSVTSLVLERGLLTAEELSEILRPEHLANPQACVAGPLPL